MGHNYSNGEVEIPPWRLDIIHEVDLIEDVAIAYGYDNFATEMPQISTIGQENQKKLLRKNFRNLVWIKYA